MFTLYLFLLDSMADEAAHAEALQSLSVSNSLTHGQEE